MFCFPWTCVSVKYVGSFPVDDRCLDDQIEQLHTQLKALRVSLVRLLRFNAKSKNPVIYCWMIYPQNVCLLSEMQEE